MERQLEQRRGHEESPAGWGGVSCRVCVCVGIAGSEGRCKEDEMSLEARPGAAELSHGSSENFKIS